MMAAETADERRLVADELGDVLLTEVRREKG